MLKPKDLKARLAFAHKYLEWTDEWKQVLFSDEKKFTLDGPDGSRCSWKDKRAEKKVAETRHSCGGSLMVLAAFGYLGATELAYIHRKSNSEDYQAILAENLLPFIDRFGRESVLFQQDNCRIHVSASSKKWFSTQKIELLGWPARSPDLNPIENLWGILVQKVYAGNRRFYSLNELGTSIQAAWKSIDQDILNKLVDSMPKRLNDVIVANGKSIDY